MKLWQRISLALLILVMNVILFDFTFQLGKILFEGVTLLKWVVIYFAIVLTVIAHKIAMKKADNYEKEIAKRRSK